MPLPPVLRTSLHEGRAPSPPMQAASVSKESAVLLPLVLDSSIGEVRVPLSPELIASASEERTMPWSLILDASECEVRVWPWFLSLVSGSPWSRVKVWP